ncbi:hypothetical protein [Komagataeibacter xylinus]|uniref:EF-hand domain-containing protein n=1 Tax=Komagataeibacter xylinus TaxID=28448 RepID=A0A857FLV4_KOMXY|nr:hypothetical protein [Komagataeibacter xylinus]QHC35181.1 hypothetical protein FMA36_06380 [Komagataeibacter xylinus]
MNRAWHALFMVIVLLALTASASAHQLDEYLQATTLNLARDHVSLRLRLTPGVDVASGIIRQMDRNGDGSLSAAEQQSYAAHIIRTLSLSLNGRRGRLLVDAMTFPSLSEIRAGTGIIDLQLKLRRDPCMGNNRLLYHNRGADPETAWLVNCLMPQDPAIHIIRQQRSADQSSYVLDFSVGPPS